MTTSTCNCSEFSLLCSAVLGAQLRSNGTCPSDKGGLDFTWADAAAQCRVRPASEFPECVCGVLLVLTGMKALPVQQRTASHQARSSCQACCPSLRRRGGGNGHGTASVPTDGPAKGQGTAPSAVAVDVSHSSVVVIQKQAMELQEPRTEYF